MLHESKGAADGIALNEMGGKQADPGSTGQPRRVPRATPGVGP